IQRIRVFGRDQERLQAFAEKVRKEFGISVVAAASIAEATDGASIITVATRATQPVISASMLSPGTHINTIAAIVPSRAELAPDVLARADKVVADSVPQARKLSRELIEFFGDVSAAWERVQPLASVVQEREPRLPDQDLTVFKSLGMGI